jgi:preprotein translocase subunit SecA
VDRQLRGRSGRQGDPGSSQFFVSLEDNLMRLFGSDRIAKLMDRMGHKEGEVIQHGMITKSIERAQRKIEENNFGIRKRLLEYDDVMNLQRKQIYSKRRNALIGDKLSLDLFNSFAENIYELLNDYNDSRDFKNFSNDFLKIFSLELPIKESEFKSESLDNLNKKMYEYVFNCYRLKIKKIKEDAFPVVNSIYLDESNNYKNIIIPFSDGIIGLNVISNLEESHKSNGESIIKDFERCIVLSIIDRYWKEHLREMDDLRQSVQGAVYEQKDPLLIYKFESLDLYKKMQNKIDLDIISFLFKAQLPSRNKQNISEAKLQSQFGKAERGRELNINNPQKNNLSNPTNSSGNNAPLSRRQRRMQERGRRR